MRHQRQTKTISMYGTALLPMHCEMAEQVFTLCIFHICRQWLLIFIHTYIYTLKVCTRHVNKTQQMGIREQLICRQAINEWN